MDSIKSRIRDVPDFPKPGIVFKDLTPVFQDAETFRSLVDSMSSHYEGQEITKIVGIESRGFILGAAMAYRMGVGLSIVRKLGKLPWDTVKQSYSLEYGTDSLEIHKDAIAPGEKVLIIDDLLATGGTAEAVIKLVKELGGEVAGIGFGVELDFLGGRKKLEPFDVFSLLHF